MLNKSTFFLLAFVIGTLIPAYYIFGFVENNGLNISLFIKELFQSKPSATFSSDLLICSFVFWVFMIQDKKDKNIPSILIFIALNLSIGLSSAMPLYFYFRQKYIEN